MQELIDYNKIESLTDEIKELSKDDLNCFHKLEIYQVSILMNQLLDLSRKENREVGTVLFYVNHEIYWNTLIYFGDLKSCRINIPLSFNKSILIHTHPNYSGANKPSEGDVNTIFEANIDINVILCQNDIHVYSDCKHPYNHTKILFNQYGKIGIELLSLERVIKRIEKEIL
jgi:hypothetical protein